MNRLVLLLTLSVLLVACSQPSTPTSPDPTVQAQATQIASLQQQVAALQTAVAQPTATPAPVKAPPAPTAQPKAPTAATTASAATRLFLEALLGGDIKGALARMSVAAQSTYSSQLPALASALAPCRQSVMEVTSPQAGATISQFTPTCVNIRTVYSLLLPELVSNSFPPSKPATGCIWLVQSVNDEWKVTGFNGCIL